MDGDFSFIFFILIAILVGLSVLPTGWATCIA